MSPKYSDLAIKVQVQFTYINKHSFCLYFQNKLNISDQFLSTTKSQIKDFISAK